MVTWMKFDENSNSLAWLTSTMVNEVWRKLREFEHVNGVWQKLREFRGLDERGATKFWASSWEKNSWNWHILEDQRVDEVLSKILEENFVKWTHFRGPKSRRSYDQCPGENFVKLTQFRGPQNWPPNRCKVDVSWRLKQPPIWPPIWQDFVGNFSAKETTRFHDKMEIFFRQIRCQVRVIFLREINYFTV